MSSSVINFVVIDNPFDPTNSAKKGHLDYERGKTLAAYMGELEGSWLTTLNGVEIRPEQWYLTYPRNGDTIIVSAIPHGSDSGKNVLRLVAVVALAYVTGGIAAGTIGGLSGATASAAAAAVSIGGTMVINAVLPPPVPDVNDGRDFNDSPTYGQDSARNTSKSGIPIPICYGDYRVAGNIIASYAENVNDEQFLYVLYNAGEGEIEGIEDILVNDQPIANFSEVSYETRMGTADQTSIGWFDSVRRQNNIGSTIVKDDWRTYTFRGLADRASIEIVFQAGLFGVSSDGDKYTYTVLFEMEYRPYRPNQAPEAGWMALPWVNDNGSISNSLYRISGRQTSTLRRTIKTGDLGENQTFEIRIRRTAETDSDYITDTATLATITEISKELVRYKHTAILGLRILMTEQLNSTPKVTYINKGVKCNVWTEAENDGEKDRFVKQATNNPAWIVYDLLTNERYGAGIPSDLINLNEFFKWAKFCEEQGLTFNGIIDTASNAFDATEPIMRLGHAKLFTLGTRVSVSVEKPDFPVMMFSQANMIRDTFSINWMPIADRANEVEVTYYDKNSQNEARTVKVYDDTSLQSGDLQRPSSFTLIGCVDESVAFYEGLLAINYNKYITQSYSFEASIDAIACTLGSVVYIQHDMPQWGYSGRLQGGNSNDSVVIDIDPADMESSPETILVHFPSLLKGRGRIINRFRDTIELDIALPDKKASRALISGIDVPIVSIDHVGGHSRIKLAPDSPGTGGETIEVFATDVFEERAIERITGNVITVDSPLSAIPDKYSQYLIGRINSVKKKARITAIEYSDDHTRQIAAIEYNESVYDKNIPFTPSPVQPDLGVIDDTVLSNIDEELIQIGKNLRPRLEINYRNSSTRYQTTQVYVSINGGNYRLIGTHRRQITYESEDGAVLDIKLVPVDTGGIVKSIDSVSPVRYVVLGKTAPPSNVNNFSIATEVGGLQLSWDVVTDLDLEGYEIRRGSTWDDGEIVTQAISSTVLFFPVSIPGLYEFMIRAVDSSGNLSQVPSLASIEIVRPDRVYNFNAVQHVDKVVMQWDRPLDRNITSFWIREGSSWSDSYIHGSVTGTSFELPATNGPIKEGTTDSSRTFWIKAVDIIGIDSEEAIFATTSVANLPDRNLVFTEYHGRVAGGPGSNAPGSFLNTSGTYPIRLNDNVNYGEYAASLTLPYPTNARNSVGLEVGVLVTNSTTWDDATFVWSSPEASSGWAGIGDPEKINFQQFISLKTSVATFYPNTEYLFSLDRKLTCDVTSISPDHASGVTYEPARHNYGVQVTETTNVEWTVSGTDAWTTGFWARMPEVFTTNVSGVAASIQMAGEPPIYILLSEVSNEIIARQSGYPDLAVGEIYPHPGDVYYVAVSQLLGERTLRVRNLAWDRTKKSVLDVGKTMQPDGLVLGFG